MFPQLADARTEFAWGGYVDITMSRAPDFNRLAPNVYYLQVFSGHGIALTAASVQDLVNRAYNLRQNARIQQQAIALRGTITSG